MDRRSDVYSLGAILYEILAGRPPLASVDALHALRRVRYEDPVRPRALVPGTPPALEAVCLRALALRREERYPTAVELAREVQRYLADEPVAAYREPLTARSSAGGGGTQRSSPALPCC